MRQTKEIELFGNKVIIAERNQFDSLELMAFTEGKEIDLRMVSFVNARVVCDSLSFGFAKMNFLKRFFLKRKYTVRKLIEKLSANELSAIAGEVLELEGVDLKKKVSAESPLVEKSQDV